MTTTADASDASDASPDRRGDGGAPTGRDVALVASDLDGTLLAPPGVVIAPEDDAIGRMGMVSPRTRAALDAIRARGIELVAVTGRPPRWVPGLGLGSGLAICSNGALVLDLSTGEVVQERTLDPDVAVEIVRRLRALHPDGMMAIEFPDGVGMEQAWHERVPRGVALEVGPAEELCIRPAAKVLLKVPGTSGDAYIDAAAEVVGDIGVVTASGGLELVEVSAPGVDKATTLALVCDERGIDASQVVAFGDARNDIPLLAWAGTAVAMGHAPEAVRRVADHVTGTNADDGVAAWIEAHLLP
jgi:Cof subfamily protein (haloacid dehalogenase superfamily)